MKIDYRNFRFCAIFAAAVLAAACGGDGGGKSTDPEPGPEPGGDEAVINGTKIEEGNDMFGLVKDSSTGKGIPGVNVTDGYSWTTTDANGVYQFNGDEIHSRDIYISVPANYKVPVDANNFPKFYSANVNREGNSRNDFTLEPQAVQENFTLMMMGDPQCKTNSDVNRFIKETIPDVEATLANGGFQNVYGFTLGDITFDNTVQWDPMLKAMSRISIGGGKYMPFFQCVGNHDHDASKNSDYAALGNFIERFGPTDYSVNIGKAHIVVMDDIIGTSTNGSTWDYVGGFSATQYKWLAKDLELVSDKEDKLLIFCAHIPFRAGGGTSSSTDGSNVNKDRYYSQVLRLMTQFKESHIMIGHTHYTQNYVHSEKALGGLPIYEHIHGAACGAWWNSNSTVTGEPNGYTIYTVEGNQITDWFLKGTNKDATFQMRVFDGNQIYPGDYALNWYTSSQKAGKSSITVRGNSALKGCFVADVFDDDDTYWKVELYKDGTKVGDFRRMGNGQVCNVAVAAYYFNSLGKNTSTWASRTASHYWYFPAPSGNPAAETGWEVRATQTIPSSGKTNVYTSSTLQKDYSGF